MEIKMFWQPCRKCKKKRMNFDDVFHLTQRVQKVTSSDQFFKKKLLRYFTFSFPFKTYVITVCPTRTEHLDLEWPHFTCSVSTAASGCHSGWCRRKTFLERASCIVSRGRWRSTLRRGTHYRGYFRKKVRGMARNR